MVGKYFKS